MQSVPTFTPPPPYNYEPSAPYASMPVAQAAETTPLPPAWKLAAYQKYKKDSIFNISADRFSSWVDDHCEEVLKRLKRQTLQDDIQYCLSSNRDHLNLLEELYDESRKSEHQIIFDAVVRQLETDPYVKTLLEQGYQLKSISGISTEGSGISQINLYWKSPDKKSKCTIL